MIFRPVLGNPVRPVGPEPVGGSPFAGGGLPGNPIARLPMNPVRMPVYHKGGKVKQTGPAMLQKGEYVVSRKKIKNAVKKKMVRLSALMSDHDSDDNY